MRLFHSEATTIRFSWRARDSRTREGQPSAVACSEGSKLQPPFHAFVRGWRTFRGSILKKIGDHVQAKAVKLRKLKAMQASAVIDYMTGRIAIGYIPG